jgi:hypothetical protein
MPLNREGIELLKADLRRYARHYNQSTFGEVTAECGTECCMAGLCLMRKMGMEEFNKYVRVVARLRSEAVLGHGLINERLAHDCVRAGAAQLGLEIDLDDYISGGGLLPHIFAPVSDWPSYLRVPYTKAAERHDHVAMAEAACRALDEMGPDGRLPWITPAEEAEGGVNAVE